VKFVGLTGGIGAGKSTVGAGVAARGVVVLDVDLLSRELQEPGRPFFEEIVARWGPAVLDAGGRLDRAALANLVFGDRKQLGELTMMAAPLVEREIVERASAYAGSETVVMVEAALYLTPMYGMTDIVVVDVPTEVAVGRLVQQRGMSEPDARARVAAQLGREARLEHAGFVVRNEGPIEALAPQLEALVAWLHTRPDAAPTLQRASSSD
jgi:dephospho-CoA kinase